MNDIIGGCSKHIGQSWINCPMCAMEEYQKNPPKIKLTLARKDKKKFKKTLQKLVDKINAKSKTK